MTQSNAPVGVKNSVQTLSREEQEMTSVNVVASNFQMADGFTQNPQRALVRMRNGEHVYIKDLPQIDPKNPQPNGDYSIALLEYHTNDYNSTWAKAGQGWLYLDNDGFIRMLAKPSYTDAGFRVMPQIRDKSAKFSTQGMRDPETDDGVYRDFLITAVSFVVDGNDPSTQVISVGLENGGGELAELNSVAELKDFIPFAASLAVKNESTEPQVEVEGKENIEGADAPEGETIMADDNTQVTPPVADPAPAPAANAVVTSAPVVPVANVVPQAPAQTTSTGLGTDGGHAWLKTDNAMTAFAEALQKGKGSGADTQRIWSGMLEENGITFNPDSVTLLPETLVDEINTIITTNGEIYNKLNHTGLMFYVDAAVATLESAKVRARGASTTKTSQNIAVEPRVIQATSVYKLLSIAYDMVARNGGMTGALVKFANMELAMKVIELIERAVVVGGVVDDAGNTISPMYIRPISSDTVAGGVYGDVYTQGADQSLPEAITGAAAMVLSGGSISLITTRARAAQLPYLTVGDSGIPLFLNSADRGSVNIPMVDDVIAPIWLTEADLVGGEGYLADLSAYYTVGDSSTQAFYQLHLRTNEHDFEAIKMFGGALAKPKAAVKLLPSA